LSEGKGQKRTESDKLEELVLLGTTRGKDGSVALEKWTKEQTNAPSELVVAKLVTTLRNFAFVQSFAVVGFEPVLGDL
jgi:hypothetical protein